MESFTIYILLIATILGIFLAYFLISRWRTNKNHVEERIQGHKDAMRERISEDRSIQKFELLDYSLFQEHKESLIARIQDEDWFGKFTNLLFSRGKQGSITQAFIQKGNLQNYELEEILKISKFQPVLIIGDAGSGKTTSLRKMAVDLCNEPEEIPLLLNLATYQIGSNLFEMMNSERQLDVNLIQNVFSYGKATVLIDQLNEIREGQDEALDALNKLMWQYRGNRYIIAVRTSKYLRIRSKTESFIPIEIQPLTQNKITAFLNRYIGEEKVKQILESMDNRLRGLCTNPLMLSMIASVYEAQNTLPNNKSDLYDTFLYQLLHNWDQKTRHTILAAYIDDVLGYVSYKLNPVITAHPLTLIQELVAEIVPELNQKYNENYTTSQISEILQLIAVTRIDRLSYKIFFIHQSLQEFYAAKYMYGLIQNGKMMLSDFKERIRNLDWMEPIFFLCGLLDDATELVELLIDMKRLYMAAQCVQNAKYIDSNVVDDLVIYTLFEFKYGDDEVGEQEVVAYDLIRALRIITEYKTNTLSKRLKDDMQFFMEKYSNVREHYTLILPNELTNLELIHLIETRDNIVLEPDYIWNLGKRQSSEAVHLLKSLILDDTYPYRDESIWSLGEAGDIEDTKLLIECVSNKHSPQIVVAACNALIRAAQRNSLDKPKAIEALVNYIEDLGNPNREAAGWALSQVAGTEAGDVYLKHMITGNNHYQRAMFVWLIGLLGIVDAVDSLSTMYYVEKEPHVREDIIFALGDLAVIANNEVIETENKRRNLNNDEAEDANQQAMNRFSKILSTLADALDDDDPVVKMQSVYALGKANKLNLIINKIDLPTESKFVQRAVKQATALLNNVERRKKVITHKEIEALSKLSARATALANRLNEITEEYKSGYLDIGRFTQLKTSVETDRLQLLTEIERIINKTNLEIIEPAIAQAKLISPGQDDTSVRAELITVAENQSWGKALLEKINSYKGEIIGLIINIALEIGKRNIGS